MSLFRGASKAPVAVAGILALPLFFVGLIAFALKLDKPSHHVAKNGTIALGDPTQGTLGTIYLLAFAVATAVVVLGVLAMPLRSRLATIVPAAAGIAASIALLIPLGSWAAAHVTRYPLGVDNIPQKSSQDLSLRGEWEQGARTTAHQVGLVVIGLSLAAILISVALEVRRRRGMDEPAVPPPPEAVGAPEMTGG